MKDFLKNSRAILESIIKYRSRSIYFRNALLILAAILVPLTILGSILFGMVTRNMEQEFRSLFLRQSQRLQGMLDNEIEKTEILADTILQSEPVQILQSKKSIDPYHYQTLQSLQQLQESYRFAISSSDLVAFVDLAFGQSRTVVRSNYGMCTLDDYEYKTWVDELMTLPLWEKTTDLVLLDTGQTKYLVRRFPAYSIATKQTDVLLIGVDLRQICLYMSGGQSDVETYLYQRVTGQVISSQSGLLSLEKAAELPLSSKMEEEIWVESKRSGELWAYTDSIFPNWTYVTRGDISQYYNQIQQYRIYFFLLMLGIVLVVIVVSFGIMQKTSEPIGMILSIVRDPSKWLGNSGLTRERVSELSQITRGFLASYQRNQELESSLNVYIQRLQETQIAALRSQINPHFLYNTLDSIYWSVLEEVPGKSGLPEVITSLSDMLRYGLKEDENLITVEQEYIHANAYINIMQYRYDYSFQVAWDIPLEMLPMKILKVTLQPMLENALTHGIGREPGGRIQVSVWAQDHMIHVAVRDNGQGFSAEAFEYMTARLSSMEQHLPADHIGLENVNLRYKLVVGPSAQMHLRNLPEGGAEVEICYAVMEDKT